MQENTEKPLLSIAALCMHVLEEKDNVLSAIRFVDTLTITLSGSPQPAEMPIVPLEISALLAFKSGPALGVRTVSFVIHSPDGKTVNIALPHRLYFSGNEQGANVITKIKMVTQSEGLHWIDVLLNNELITRMPLKIIYKQDADTAPETGS